MDTQLPSKRSKLHTGENIKHSKFSVAPKSSRTEQRHSKQQSNPHEQGEVVEEPLSSGQPQSIPRKAVKSTTSDSTSRKGDPFSIEKSRNSRRGSIRGRFRYCGALRSSSDKTDPGWTTQSVKKL